ncbi:uncharacterized protein KNAG_0I02710 [Huiozyma naganishii CBS 8797]|uniref:C2H2-type domain-containing protein n=1 Tax=Huiozyma naganishii (strain ATCC MYA-139 / BCRC 22969 / CBS 8797 / KCTC 17520 / NBRC 10181 / NCYC 3082 / Yp74L-3) TaxID=1071383 RepID=J7SAD1_HUIN7|nr:hypothetical protein KNAG_0I02710 [Kazachstania naganishii CBS 8797]CCK72056.1 hypothetical protein KNAG_0I02710 [Kazachstania naganishii CBS 8797]
MVTFNCEVCNDTVPKKNTEKHYYRCPQAYFTCIDCSKTFEDGVSYKKHTVCISEDEKYQKALYKGGKKNKSKQDAPQKAATKQPAAPVEKLTPAKIEKPKKQLKNNHLKDGESLYQCLKSFKDKDEKKKFLKSLVLRQSTDGSHFTLEMN